jgi:hypothetical protein
MIFSTASRRERLDVGRIGHLRVGHDRRRVRVDQHDAVPLLAQRLAGLGAGVVELAGLADDDRPGADDQDGRALLALKGERFAVTRDVGGPGRLDAVTLRPWGSQGGGAPKRPSVNERFLRQGLCFFRARSQSLSGAEQLSLASAAARAAGRGVWAEGPRLRGAPPVQRGAVLGLYFKEERFDYHEQLRRVKAVGAEWVTLLLTCFVERVDSVVIDRSGSATVTDARLRETVAFARKLGLRVALMPVVLIREAGEDDWRGTLRPRDLGQWWLAYDEMLGHYLDISRETGIELVYVGSELCSLEDQHEAWRRVIRNARGRYGGWLGYSANWDHLEVPRFWPLLDQVGLTAYFELTDELDPEPQQLEVAWRRVREELARLSKRLGRELVLTELGYPSQNGANTAPWNYYLAPDDIDLEEQAACLRAFAAVMHDAPFLRGVQFFDFFERGGAQDSTYAVWGKPAQGVVQEFLRTFRRAEDGEEH